MTTYADAYEEYLSHGWQGVLPLPPRKKYPPPKNTTGLGAADPPRIKMARWAASPIHGEGGVALRLPEIVVGIDVDHYGDKQGLDVLADLEDALGPLPATWLASSRTNGSGIRLYVVPPGRAFYGDVGEGIDIVQRAHRYVAAWPTIHPDTGESYLWLDSETLEPYEAGEIPDLDDLPALPEAWLDRITDQYKTDNPRGTNAEAVTDVEIVEFVERFSNADKAASILDAERHRLLAEAKNSATVGKRHDTVLSVLGKAARSMTAGLLAPRPFLDELETWYVEAKRDEQPEEVTRRDFVRGLAYAVGQALVDYEYLEPAEASQTLSEGSTGFLSGSPLNLLDWKTVRDLPEPRWLVYPVLLEGAGHLIYADSKLGKSLLSLYMAVQLATGGEFLGKSLDPASVLYVDYEMSPQDVVDRLEGWGVDFDNLDRLHYALAPWIPPLDTAAGGAELVNEATRLGVDLVVIDTISRAVDGDENAAQTYTDFYRHTGSALKREGVAVLRIDHIGKAGAGPRGSSAKTADVDIIYKLKRDGGARNGDARDQMQTLELDRARRVMPLQEIGLHRTATGFTAQVGATTANVALHGGDGVSEEACRMIEVLCENGFVELTGRNHRQNGKHLLSQRNAEQLLDDAGIEYKIRPLREAVKFVKTDVERRLEEMQPIPEILDSIYGPREAFKPSKMTVAKMDDFPYALENEAKSK